MHGALNDGASWFFAPADNCPDLVGHIPDGLQVIPVATLEGALDALESIRAGDELPRCAGS
jgi:PDZ domain-containing protein